MVQDASSENERHATEEYYPLPSHTHLESQQEKFHMSEHFFRQIIDSLEDYAVFTTDRDGNITSWNAGAKRIFGYTEQEIIGANEAVLLPFKKRNQKIFERELQNALNDGKVTEEKWHVRKDGHRFWGGRTVTLLKDEQSHTVGFTKFVRDLTEKKLLEEKERALADVQRRLHDVFIQFPAPLCLHQGPELVYEFVNQPYQELFGNRELRGKPLREALPELETQGLVRIVEQVYETGIPFQATGFPAQIEKNGRFEARFFDFVVQPIRNEAHTIEGVIAFGYEVTERKKAEETLKNSEERFRALIEQSADAIQMVTPEGEILYTSDSIKQVLGYTPEEIKGHVPVEFIHPDDIAYFMEKIQFLLQHSTETVTFQYRVKHKDGSWAWIEATGANHLNTPNIHALIGNFRNITARKQVEEERQKLITLIESSNDYIGLADREGKSIYVNRAGKEMVGIDDDQIGTFAILDNFPPEEHERAKAALVRLEHEEQFVEEIYFRNIKTGKTFPVSWAGITIRDESGTLIAYGTVTRDITRQKQLEQQKDDFMGIVSHELKTPVTSIKAFTQVLQRRFAQEGNEQATTLLGKMDVQINKLTALIADLLDVTKIEGGKLQLNEDFFFFDELVEEIVEEIQRTTSKHVIEREGAAHVTIYADQDRIGQVIINLLSNAIKYSPRADRILVKLSTDEHNVTLCVQDFGVGIPEEKQEHVFERFYRVSGKVYDTMPGLGLGLYISYEIIRRQGGTMWVASEEGKGSTFCFTLPLQEQDVKQMRNTSEQDEVQYE